MRMGFAAGLLSRREVGLVPGSEDSQFAEVLQLSAGRPVFTADYCITDTVGQVGSFVDHNDPTHLLTQPASNLRVLAPAAHIDYRGKQCATFVSTVPTWYASNRAASAWKFLHDGTGRHFVFSATNTLGVAAMTLASTYQSGATNGCSLLNGATTNDVRTFITNNAGAFAVDLTSAGAFATGVPTYFQTSYQESISPEAAFRAKSALVSSMDSAVVPGTNDPSATMNLGRRPTNANFCSMRWRHLMCFPQLTDAQRRRVESYMQRDSGL